MLFRSRHVVATATGYESGDGLEPSSLAPDTLVSMNLWGFDTTMWDVFRQAMASAAASEDAEVLLPEIVGEQIGSGATTFHAIPATSRCVGVTHADDLPVVQAEIARQVARGERGEFAFGR